LFFFPNFRRKATSRAKYTEFLEEEGDAARKKTALEAMMERYKAGIQSLGQFICPFGSGKGEGKEGEDMRNCPFGSGRGEGKEGEDNV
jgi:hypothetical protein